MIKWSRSKALPQTKAPGAGQGFAARMDGSCEFAGRESGGGDSAAAGAMHGGGVGFIDDDCGAIFLRERDDGLDGSNVAVHAENRFGHDELSPGPVLDSVSGRTPER